MKYLFRKPHTGRKPQRVKLGRLPLLIAESNKESSSKAHGAGEIVFITMPLKMDRGERARIWPISSSEGRGRNSGDRPGLSPPCKARSPACQGIRIPGLQDKGPSPLVSLPVLGDCVALLFDQTKGIMSADNCFKYQGFRAGSWVPLVFSVKGIMAAPRRISAFLRNDQVL